MSDEIYLGCIIIYHRETILNLFRLPWGYFLILFKCELYICLLISEKLHIYNNVIRMFVCTKFNRISLLNAQNVNVYN